MSTPNHNAATTLPIHGPIDIAPAVNDIASPSQDNKLLPSENNSSLPSQPITTTSSANTNPSNLTTIQSTSLPSQGSIIPSNLQNSTTMNKIKNKKRPGNIKDWDKMTLAERLEAKTDLPLKPKNSLTRLKQVVSLSLLFSNAHHRLLHMTF
ncbi:hypothetical protein KCU91_g16794, partial [Aureobasidium melanogenum]